MVDPLVVGVRASGSKHDVLDPVRSGPPGRSVGTKPDAPRSVAVGNDLITQGDHVIPRGRHLVAIVGERRFRVPHKALQVRVRWESIVLAVVLAQREQIRTERRLQLRHVKPEILEGDGITGLRLLDNRTGLRVESDVWWVAAVDSDLDLLLERVGTLIGRGVVLVGVVDLVVDHRLDCCRLSAAERTKDVDLYLFGGSSSSASARGGDHGQDHEYDQPSNSLHESRPSFDSRPQRSRG